MKIVCGKFCCFRLPDDVADNVAANVPGYVFSNRPTERDGQFLTYEFDTPEARCLVEQAKAFAVSGKTAEPKAAEPNETPKAPKAAGKNPGDADLAVAPKRPGRPPKGAK